MSAHSYKGLFITFEGGEGAGKTTLINSLYDAIREEKLKAIKTREPGGTPLGAHIRSILLEKHELAISSRAELLLFLADRAHHVEEIILPALGRGEVVLCDRYSDSTFAYQGAYDVIKNEDLVTLTKFATKGLVPHLTIYLDIDPVVGIERAKRSSFDRMEQKQLDFHYRVRQNFLHLAEKEPQRFFTVDATLPPDEVFSIVWTHFKKRFYG